jgi:hypothetical protein
VQSNAAESFVPQQHSFLTFKVAMRIALRLYPPAIAPMINRGSLPDATASGSGASGDS